MTQPNKQLGRHRCEHRGVRLPSVALSGIWSLPRASTDIGGVIAPSGPPG